MAPKRPCSKTSHRPFEAPRREAREGAPASAPDTPNENARGRKGGSPFLFIQLAVCPGYRHQRDELDRRECDGCHPEFVEGFENGRVLQARGGSQRFDPTGLRALGLESLELFFVLLVEEGFLEGYSALV